MNIFIKYIILLIIKYIYLKNIAKKPSWNNTVNEYGSFLTHVVHYKGSDTKMICIQKVTKDILIKYLWWSKTS